MVSQHTAENKDSLTTKQPKGETAIPSKFKDISMPKEIVEKRRDPPLQSCRRDGSRVVIGTTSPSEQPVFRDALFIERPSEFDISHSGH